MSNKQIAIIKYRNGRVFANDSEVFADPTRPAGFCGEWVTPWDLRDHDAEIKAAILATIEDGQERNLDYTDANAEADRITGIDEIEAHQERMASVMSVQG